MLKVLIVMLAIAIALLAVWLFAPGPRYQRFFSAINFKGYDNKFPRYGRSKKISDYLKVSSFRSRIPKSEWAEVGPYIEQFQGQRIYDIQQRRDDIRTTDIFFIIRELPSLILWNDSYMPPGDKFAIGVGFCGQVVWDSNVLHHGVVAGATGGGKTGILRSIVHQSIIKQWNVTVLDFKGGGDFIGLEGENCKYHDLEHSYGPFIVSDPTEARHLLLGLVIEVKGRLEAFRDAGITNINEYNTSGKGFFVPWLVVIDEAAELLDVKPTTKEEKELYSEINQSLRTLARISRAAGVHLLLGYIRPSADALDGQIKNNLLFRVCGFFADPSASRIVLDNDRATELPPEIKGRFIVGEEETQVYYLPPNPDKS